MEKARLPFVSCGARWAGPYRFNRPPLSIEFDVPVHEVKKRLLLHPRQPSIGRNKLFQFTLSYARAQWLIAQGKLVAHGQRRAGDTAYRRLLGLAADATYSRTMRLFARLAAVQVLFRIGRFRIARAMLTENEPLLRQVPDGALKAHFYAALAWSHQRSTSGAASDRAVEAAIRTASAFAETSGDRTATGLIAHRMGGYLTKKGRHLEAADHFAQAVWAHLITGNFAMVQASCGNVGSVLHRLGSAHYSEARRWLLLGIAIARWMRLGRDDAHAEMILGKIYVETGKSILARYLLQRAERIAEGAGNQVNYGDVKMVWGFWQQRFGTRMAERDTLIRAVRIFRSIAEFDHQQKEQYMAREFPEIWPAVVARA
jgi:hypothetical protein